MLRVLCWALIVIAFSLQNLQSLATANAKNRVLTTRYSSNFSGGGGGRRELAVQPNVQVEEGKRLTKVEYNVGSSASLVFYRTLEFDRAYLGISTVEIDEAHAAKPAEAYRGILITSVKKESAAEQAGLLVGDKLISVNSVELSTPGQLRLLVKYHSLEEPMHLRVLRNEKELEIDCKLEARTQSIVDLESFRLASVADNMHLGMKLGQLEGNSSKYFFPQERQAVIVLDIIGGSPAFYSDIRIGDILLAADSTSITTAIDLRDLAKAKAAEDKVINFTFKRGMSESEGKIEPASDISGESEFTFPFVVGWKVSAASTKWNAGLGFVANYSRKSTVRRNEHHQSKEFGMLLNLIKYKSSPRRTEFCLLWFICLKW